MLRVTALVAVLAMVTACQATDYKPAISAFAGAAAKSDDAFATMRLTVLEERLAAQEKMILAGRRVLDTKATECLPRSARCHLVSTDLAGKDEQVLSDTEGLDNLHNAMHGIALYAGKLAAIVDAPTARNAMASLTAAEASIKSAAESASKLPGARIDAVKLAAVADPAVPIINWIVGEYVNQVKIAALRVATQRASPLVDAVADLITRYMDSTGNPIIDAASRTFESSTGLCFKDTHDAKKLADCLAAARVLDEALTASRPNVFVEMKVAHGKLAAQLAGQDVSFSEVVDAITTFATKADQLWQSVQQLRKAVSPPGAQT